MTDDTDDAARRRARHWLRRARAAEEGRHLPSVSELLRGMCFLGDKISEDAKIWAERVAPKIRNDELRRAVEGLTVSIDRDAVREMLVLFESVSVSDFSKENLGVGSAQRDRVQIYAASLGDSIAALHVAAIASNLAAILALDTDERAAYTAAAIGWLQQSKSRFGWSGGSRVHQRVLSSGRALLAQVVESNAKEEPVQPSSTPQKLQAHDELAPPPSTAAPPGRVVVVRSIGSLETAEGRRVRTAYGDIVGRPLPLVRVPDDLSAIRKILIAEFPHAASIVDVLLADLDGRDYIKFRPTVLVGEPGCGKTTFAMRLLEILGVPQDLVSGPSHQDGAFAGTPRRWNSTAPSAPISLIKRTGVANPAVVVDEIEKASRSRHHGQLHDVLLTMLEPVTARAWADPHFESPVDLSHVNWIATANSLEGIPGPLRDRMRIMRFPSPTSEHLEVLAASILRRIVAERGLDERWTVPFDGEELEALRAAWSGGSLRKLQRLVGGVLSARDQWQTRMAH